MMATNCAYEQIDTDTRTVPTLDTHCLVASMTSMMHFQTSVTCTFVWSAQKLARLEYQIEGLRGTE